MYSAGLRMVASTMGSRTSAIRPLVGYSDGFVTVTVDPSSMRTW